MNTLKTGKLRLAEPLSMQGFETVAAKCGGGKFSDIGIPRLEAVLGDGDIAVIYGAQNIIQVEGLMVIIL
ncbi:hypothetical protein [Chryseobacterium hagamense]|nr:hypothetical protein [Chryseobacterium hagamense]